MTLYDKLKPEHKKQIEESSKKEILIPILETEHYQTDLNFFTVWNLYRVCVEESTKIDVVKFYELFYEVE